MLLEGITKVTIETDGNPKVIDDVDSVDFEGTVGIGFVPFYKEGKIARLIREIDIISVEFKNAK